MGTTIGEVSINLRLSTAQFQQDVKSGADASQQATKKIADDTKENIGEARETLRLLAEDIGVKVPRGITNFIASLPGVNQALTAAFDVVALVGVIDVITKIVDAFVAFKEQAQATQEAIDAFGNSSEGAVLSLEGQFIKLQEQMDNLKGDSVAALADQIRAINNQTLQSVVAQFKSVQDQANKTFDSIKLGMLQTILNATGLEPGGGKEGISDFIGGLLAPLTSQFSHTNDSITNLKAGLDDLIDRVERLQKAGDTAAASGALTDAITKVQAALKATPSGAYKEALQVELDELLQLNERYTDIHKNADMSKEIANTADLTATYKAQAAELDSLTQKTQQALKPPDKIDDQEAAIQKLIQGWKNYRQELESEGVISVEANNQIPLLTAKLTDLQSQAQAAADKVENLTEADLKLVQALVSAAPPKVFVEGSAQVQQYYESLTQLNQQLQDGTISTEQFAVATQNLKYQFGIGGAATGVHQFFMEFQQGQSLAKDTFNFLNTALNGFEQDLAETLTKGTANWQDFFDQIEEMILKSSLSTLFSSLLGFANNNLGQNGGFLGDFFGDGGLFSSIGTGHAEGIAAGPLDAGTLYPIGENGPEYFRPSVPGQVLNQGDIASMGKRSQKTGVTTIQQTINITGVTDADSFKRSEPQIRAQMYRASSQAHARLTR